MATGTKKPKAKATTKPTQQPDFKHGDRVAGELTTKVYTKEYPSRQARMRDQMRVHMSSFSSYDRFPEPVYVGDPEYEDGWQMRVERKGSEEFFNVVVPPYKVGNKWHMTIANNSTAEHEVDCEDFHLVGERQPPKKIEPSFEEKLLKRVKKESKKMSKAAIVTAIVLGVIGVFFLWIVGNFNSLVTMNEDVDNSWSKVETTYQRRFDLIGNLVESVKGSQLQEQEVFKAIANARSQYQAAQQSGNENAQAQAASSVETNLALVPRLQEAYPELKSNQNVQNLMKELTGTEDGIATARNTYNDVVTNYNKGVQSFPKVIFASLFGYKERAQFKANAAAATAPTVNFTSPAVQSSPVPKAAN